MQIRRKFFLLRQKIALTVEEKGKSTIKALERYLMFAPKHILVTLRWNDRRFLVTRMSVTGF